MGGTGYIGFKDYTNINLVLGRKARRAASSEWAAGEHRGTRVRAGAWGEESFSSSQKVTARWGSFDEGESGRPGGSRYRVWNNGLGGAQGKSSRGFPHHGIPYQDFPSSQKSKLAVNWLYTRRIFAAVGSRVRVDPFSTRLTASVYSRLSRR